MKYPQLYLSRKIYQATCQLSDQSLITVMPGSKVIFKQAGQEVSAIVEEVISTHVFSDSETHPAAMVITDSNQEKTIKLIDILGLASG